ncbi:MAG TPA: histidine kinase [Chitinophagaceae bacterium]
MSWHEFVFSNQSKHRIRRHLVCWLLWWLFIILTVFYTAAPAPFTPRKGALPVFIQHQAGLNELGFFSYSLLVLIKSFLLVIVHLFFCYAIIYILLPAFQLKKNYWMLISGIVLACALVIPLGYFLYAIVYPFIDKIFDLPLARTDKIIMWRSIDASLLNGIKVTLIAVAIVLLKWWWEKQKEKEKLEKEKINAELQLLKAQIHPAFLFSTLNNIIEHARVASPKAPEMLIKLSDLLSYMLYECDAPKVKLEKELVMLKEYISLEKIRQGENLEITFQIKGNLNGQFISPLLLLPFIDNSLSYSNNKLIEQAWVNLDITIEENNLAMKLINGMPAGINAESWKNEERFANVQKRLHLLYPGSHDLKINMEQELLVVQLNLKLE